MKDVKISTSLVAVPFVHLLLASIYLYAYCVGFGANIESFAAVTDIFATSIGSIAPLYSLVVFAGLMTSWKEIKNWATTGSPYPVLVGPQQPPLKPPFSRPWVVSLKALWIIGTVFQTVVDFLLSRPMDLFYPAAAIAFSVLFSNWFVRVRSTADVTIALAVTIAVFITLVAGIGSGQAHRHASFQAMAKQTSTCGDYAVLRRFSDLYLVVDREGQHRLIDKDCKVKFDVPRVRARISISDMPEAIRWLFEVDPVTPPAAARQATTPPTPPLAKS